MFYLCKGSDNSGNAFCMYTKCDSTFYTVTFKTKHGTDGYWYREIQELSRALSPKYILKFPRETLKDELIDSFEELPNFQFMKRKYPEEFI